MTTIAQVKVWKNPAKTECRIYVKMLDGREGCHYLTGNSWNKKGSYTGNMTAEEWQEARQLSIQDGKWTTRWESELHGTIFGKPIEQRNTRFRCPDCGGYDCSPVRCDGWRHELARSAGEDHRDSDSRYEG